MYKLEWEYESGGCAGGSWSGDVLKIKDGDEVIADLYCDEAQAAAIVYLLNSNYEFIHPKKEPA